MASSKRRGETPEGPIPSKRSRVDENLTGNKAEHDDAPSQLYVLEWAKVEERSTDQETEHDDNPSQL
ncbi:hypothetical protein HII31_06559 [Pseudocercospora fuligena]|uniref:Uncharacterized protein n=1 Tax=Pseudocercospora fuligena TaxID=685502 RepID=A0A8H6RJU2_9PEZI|nr:hypothetical protein HII31_06559 [Pseudocercospora fuligena]